MASGKLSNRQKMINLMYLVFISMIAMQMSKEVLSAFGYMNEKLSANNISTEAKNQSILSNLATKASEQPEKYKALHDIASSVNNISNEYNLYLENKKNELLEGKEDKTDYETMDQMDIVDSHFFVGDGYTTEGQEFLDKINGYRNDVIGLIGENSPLTEGINKRFDTSDKKIDEISLEPWLQNRYQGFPLISTITNLTAIQTDIRNTQADIFNTLLGGQLESDVSMTTYEAIVISEKSAYFQGENFKGKIVLGKVDDKLKPTRVEVNGREISNENLQAGQVLLDFPAGSVGEKDIKGVFVFTEKGEEIPIPITSSYAVIPKPNSAVISADKMNVVYRGVANPMTISIPGVPDNLVKASASGLNPVSGSGKYTMTPGSGREVTINVTGTLSDGQTVRSSQKFRIKDIPAPLGAVRKETGYVKMPKTTLDRVTVSAELPDFDFDLRLATSGFTIKVPGQSAVVVRGNKMNAQAKKAIARAKRGDVIGIFDIKSSLVGNSSYKIKNAAAISIEIQ